MNLNSQNNIPTYGILKPTNKYTEYKPLENNIWTYDTKSNDSEIISDDEISEFFNHALMNDILSDNSSNSSNSPKPISQVTSPTNELNISTPHHKSFIDTIQDEFKDVLIKTILNKSHRLFTNRYTLQVNYPDKSILQSAISYEVGFENTPVDLEKAFKILHSNFKLKQTNANYLFHLGRYYENGIGVNQNLDCAYEFYQKAALKNHIGAKFKIAELHFKENTPSQFKKAFHLFQDLFDDINYNSNILNTFDQFILKETQYFIGICYLNGYGTSINLVKAARFLQKAAIKKHVIAQYLFAKCNYFGFGIKKNIAVSFIWLESSAKKNYPEAQNILAQFYEKGLHVHKNLETAMHYYKLAAEQGHIMAQNAIIRLHTPYL